MKKLIEKYDLVVAGTRYEDETSGVMKYFNAGGLKPGDHIDVVVEPTNPVDQFAVAVKNRGYDLGYIPKDENIELFYYLSCPEQFEVETIIKKKDDNRDMIVVIVQVYAITEDYRIFSLSNFNEWYSKKPKKNIKQEWLEPSPAKPNKKGNGCLNFLLIMIIFVFCLWVFRIIFG